MIIEVFNFNSAFASHLLDKWHNIEKMHITGQWNENSMKSWKKAEDNGIGMLIFNRQTFLSLRAYLFKNLANKYVELPGRMAYSTALE